MKKLLFVFSVFCLFQTTSVVVNASSCVESYVPLIVSYSRADSVFVGKIKNIRQTETPSELRVFNEKYRLAKFEIQKIYKGLSVSTKEIVLLNVSKSADFEADELKTGQSWIVFTNKFKGKLYFGGMCNASSELGNGVDLADYENEIFSVTDKQAIMGRIVDQMTFEKLKDIEVVLEGNKVKLVKRTDNEGLFYFPVQSAGKYKITVNLPFYGLSIGYKILRKTIDIRESEDKNSSPTKTIIIYEPELKLSEFIYEYIEVFIMPMKK